MVKRSILAIAAFAAMSLPADARGLIRDSEIERTLRDMSAPVLQAAGLAPSTVDLFILNDNSLNAFVAGGRRMFLHTGLLIDLETPEELLGVIAHEAGHIAGGHEARRAINLRNAQGPALVGLLVGIAAGVAGGGEAGAALTAGAQGALRRSLLSFNRAEEASADQAGLTYLRTARINPEGLLKVLERFRGQEVLSVGNIDPYVLTHPLGTERMSLLQRKVEADRGKSWPEDPDRIYWHARMRAKLEGFVRPPERVLDDVEDQPETEATLYAKAVALHRLPATREALDTVDRLIAKRPNDPFYIELKGQILLESARAAEAVPAYRKAVKLAPNEPLIKAGLGRALLQLNTPAANAEALEVLQTARADDLADVAALRDLATAYDRAGDRGMATLATAERYALVGNTKNAVRLAQRAQGLLPKGSPGWLRAQDILKLRKKTDRREERFAMNMGLRLTLTSLACAVMLTAAPVAADPLDLDAMTDEDRAAFRAEMRAYLLENPEVIMEAIQILEQRRQVAEQEADRNIVLAQAQALYEDGFSYVAGNPDGDVTVVEFLDYRCGFCKRAHPMVEELLDRDPNVRLIVKEFPILGPESVTAGKMALAALDLDKSKYGELHDQLITYRGNLTEQVAYRIAGELGFDLAALKSHASSPEIDDRLQQNYQLAQALGVQGTPAFIVGTEVIRGFLPIEDMLAAVAEARVQQN